MMYQEKSTEIDDETLDDLRLAIGNLQQFAALNKATPVPHFYHIDFKEGRLVFNEASEPSMVGLAYCFITSLFSETVRRQHEERRTAVQNELLKSIEVIRNHYSILNRLKEGDEGQQKLAETAMSVIAWFNRVVDDQHANDSWGQWIARFLFKQTGFALSDELKNKTIELPLVARQECQSPSNSSWHAMRTTQALVSTLIKPVQGPKGIVIVPTHREVDAFRVKAVTMIRNYGFPSTSMSEALKAVRQAPVQCASELKSDDQSNSHATIVTFRQTLQPFPGELIVLEGSFRRDTESKVASVPIPDSFRLFSKSSQTGFPHPVQYNGWGLNDKLLPSYPDFIDRLPLYRTLYEHKRKIALGLLPQGRLLAHAKILLEKKHELYEIYHHELLSLHRRLALTMLKASGISTDSQEFEQVKAIFRKLKTGAAAIEKLAQVYHRFGEAAIEKPTEHLQTAWADLRSSTEWLAKSSSERFAYAKQIYLDGVDQARHLLATQTEGNDLGPLRPLALILTDAMREGCCDLVMQYMSEKMGFEAIDLSPFAAKLQQSVIKQLMTFLIEMELEIPQDQDELRTLLKDRLFVSLESDIAYFESKPKVKLGRSVMTLATELKNYYHSRRATASC